MVQIAVVVEWAKQWYNVMHTVMQAGTQEKHLEEKSKENKAFTRVDFWSASWRGAVH